ncbi:MAG TPA: polysaccharide deacetylase family protein [Thermoplasmata archaeon]|nr:polysaccharide deacetylase family protein [Thermoplasmata archaeon]
MVDSSPHRVVVLSVDVEPDVAMFAEGHVGLEEGLPRLADLFRRRDIPADYFFTLDAAQMVPDFLREQAANGRWFGSHGVRHTPAHYALEPVSWQERAIDDSTAGLTGLAGTKPQLFRSPNFSVSPAMLRALDRLGYRADSSVLPGRVKRRRLFRIVDHQAAPREPYHPHAHDFRRAGSLNLWEVPVTENPRAPGGPIGLGFVHAEGPETALYAARESVGTILTILCHTWEAIDLGRLHPDLPAWLTATCRANLQPFEAFLESLQSEYEFRSLRDIIRDLSRGGVGR